MIYRARRIHRIVGRLQQTPLCRHRAQRVEELRSDCNRGEPDRVRPAGKIHLLVLNRGDSVEHLVVALIHEIGIGDRPGAVDGNLPRLRHDEPLCFREGERLEEDGLHDAEDCRGRTDPEREREHLAAATVKDMLFRSERKARAISWRRIDIGLGGEGNGQCSIGQRLGRIG